MRILIGIVLLVHVASIVFFNTLQSLFFSWDLSWTFSKLLPYLLVGLSGVFFSFLFHRYFHFKNWILHIFQLIVCATIGFGIAFWINPIYEGDFNASGKKVHAGKTIDGITDDFVMVALPDCPFCHEAVQNLNKLQKRNPRLKIGIVVLTAFESKLKSFKAEANTKINVNLAKDLDKLSVICGPSYPVFIQFQAGKIVEIWSNNELGAPAFDKLEASQD